MAKPILSFEEYTSKAKGSQIEETDETLEESCEICDNDPCTCEKTGQEDEEVEVEVNVNQEDEDEDEDEDEEEDEDDEDEEEDEDDEDEDDEDEPVATLLKEIYEKAKAEACAYEGDDYPEHTVEMYVKEMTSINAGMLSEMYEAACSDVKESEMTKETFEAACNEMKDAFAKRIDELKEAWSAK